MTVLSFKFGITCTQAAAFLFASCVTLGKRISVTLSFLIYKWGNNTYVLGRLQGLNVKCRIWLPSPAVSSSWQPHGWEQLQTYTWSVKYIWKELQGKKLIYIWLCQTKCVVHEIIPVSRSKECMNWPGSHAYYFSAFPFKLPWNIIYMW